MYNIQAVVNDIRKDKNLPSMIVNFCESTDNTFDYAEVEERILNDTLFAALFAQRY